mmetsp:Transcript_45067/g.86188  ORF Transcript_45067/g.86188 Transcript_45067/m.86188 type:complete len:231 (-) Transcript_45067:613-1305(-)
MKTSAMYAGLASAAAYLAHDRVSCQQRINRAQNTDAYPSRPIARVYEVFEILPDAIRQALAPPPQNGATMDEIKQLVVDAWLKRQTTSLLRTVDACKQQILSDRTMSDEASTKFNNCIRSGLGFSLEKSASAIGPNAGDGVFMRGRAEAGSVLTFYAGPVYTGLVNPLAAIGNGHLMGRYDGSSIDGRACSGTDSEIAPAVSRLVGSGSTHYRQACGSASCDSHALGQVR